MPGGASAILRLGRSYVSSLHSDRVRDVDLSLPVPSANNNIIYFRMGIPRHVAVLRKPRRFNSMPGCTHATANSDFAAIDLAQLQAYESVSFPPSNSLKSRIIADWWHDWKIWLRKII